jgi:hypothetical protein
MGGEELNAVKVFGSCQWLFFSPRDDASSIGDVTKVFRSARSRGIPLQTKGGSCGRSERNA